MLNSIPNTSIIWEPLHVTRGLVPPELNLGWMPYIPEYETCEEVRDILNKILSGLKVNDWSSRESTPFDFLFTKRFIVKFVRANALLPWVIRNFNLRSKPIYFLRHPVPTAISQIKAFYYDEPFRKFEVPQQIFNDVYKDHFQFLHSLDTKLEQQVAIWCIHNSRTLKHKGNGKFWHILFYEKLLMNPEEELYRLSCELAVEFPKSILQRISEPSKTDYKNDFISSPEKQLSKWTKDLSKLKLNNIDRILKYFDINLYSAYETMPNLFNN